MTRLGYFVLVVVLVAAGAAGYFVVRSRNAAVLIPTPSPSATVKPSFTQSGEVTSLGATQITIRFLKSGGVGDTQQPIYDSLVTPIVPTTRVVRLTKNAQDGGYTEVAAKLSDIKVGMQVAVQLSEKDAIALFPQKITILPQ